MEVLVLLLLAIVGFSAGGKPSGLVLYTLIVLATVAMGIQGAAVRSLGVYDVSTTYITGTWTDVAGMPTSPYTNAISGSKFFRVLLQ